MQKATRDQYWPRCAWVFHRFGEQLKDFRDVWERACRRAKLWDEQTGKPTRLLHDLRRTRVRNLLRAGNTEKVAMKISGHKARGVFDRYDICDERDLKAAASKLGAYVKGQSEAARKAEEPIPESVN